MPTALRGCPFPQFSPRSGGRSFTPGVGPALALDPGRRYPVAHLLHGMRGSPSSIYRSLRLPTVADGLIASGQSPPFTVV